MGPGYECSTYVLSNPGDTPFNPHTSTNHRQQAKLIDILRSDPVSDHKVDASCRANVLNADPTVGLAMEAYTGHGVAVCMSYQDILPQLAAQM